MTTINHLQVSLILQKSRQHQEDQQIPKKHLISYLEQMKSAKIMTFMASI
jgi:hypothetical protein